MRTLIVLVAALGIAVSAQTRSAKLAEAWAKVSATPYTAATLPGWSGKDVTSPGNLIKFATEDMAQSFDLPQDNMPDGRKKFIHSLGATAQAVFVADPQSKFSGLFKGADSCLARLSLAKTPGTNDFIPGMAFKCFRDGAAPSGNFITMFSLDGQTTNFNFFANPFSNIVSTPTATTLKILAKAVFGRTSRCPTWISTVDFSTADQTGAAAATPAWPIQMFLVPTGTLSFPATAGKEFRNDILSIPSGTKLWDVYGQEFNKPATRVRVGQIETRSAFVSSQYQDEQLFFQHARGERDNCPSGDIKTSY